MNTSLHDGLHDAWKVKFPEDLFSVPLENLLRTAIVVIILIRGVTTHIYLASHLLVIVPLINDRLRFALVIWLVIFGIRSFLVNLVATGIGLFVCSCLPIVHPACFRFAGVKGLELGCSAFLWFIISAFLRQLGGGDSSRASPGEQLVQRLVVSHDPHWNYPDMQNFMHAEKQSHEDSGSGESLYSLVAGTLSKINKKRVEGVDLCETERRERIATGAVYTFLEKAFGLKLYNEKADMKDKATRMFLDTHHEDIEKFIIQIENYINANILKGNCCSACRKQLMQKEFKKIKEKEKKPNYGMHYVDYPRSYRSPSDRNEESKKLFQLEEKFKRELNIQTNESFDSFNTFRSFSKTEQCSNFDCGKSYDSPDQGTSTACISVRDSVFLGNNEGKYNNDILKSEAGSDDDLPRDGCVNKKLEPRPGPSSSRGHRKCSPRRLYNLDLPERENGSGESSKWKCDSKSINDINLDSNEICIKTNSSTQTRKMSKSLLKKIKERESGF